MAILFLPACCGIDLGDLGCSRDGGDTGGGGDTLLNYTLDEMLIVVDKENCVPGMVVAYSRSGEKMDACDGLDNHLVIQPKTIREAYNLFGKLDSLVLSANDNPEMEAARRNIRRHIHNIYWGIYRGAPDIREKYVTGKRYQELK